MKPTDVLVCGNPTIDELVGQGRPSFRPGGSALFASCAASFLGSRVGILGNIGEDYPPATLRRLGELHIGTNSLRTVEGPSTRFRITRLDGSRKLQLLEPGDPIAAPHNQRFFQGVHLGPVFNEISRSLVNTLRSRCGFLSADLQGFTRAASGKGVVRTVPRNLRRMLGKCNMVQASIGEARVQTRSRDPRGILSKFLIGKVEFAIVTMGKRGSWLGSQRVGAYWVPAFPDPSIRDSTGAGDVFAGSWVSTYLSTRDPFWASSVGSAFASLSSRRTGLSKFQISRTELFKRAGWVYNRVKASRLV